MQEFFVADDGVSLARRESDLRSKELNWLKNGIVLANQYRKYRGHQSAIEVAESNAKLSRYNEELVGLQKELEKTESALNLSIRSDLERHGCNWIASVIALKICVFGGAHNTTPLSRTSSAVHFVYRTFLQFPPFPCRCIQGIASARITQKALALMEMRHQRINNTTYHEALLGLGVGQLAGAVATLWVGPLTGIATTAVVAGVVAGSLSW